MQDIPTRTAGSALSSLKLAWCCTTAASDCTCCRFTHHKIGMLGDMQYEHDMRQAGPTSSVSCGNHTSLKMSCLPIHISPHEPASITCSNLTLKRWRPLQVPMVPRAPCHAKPHAPCAGGVAMSPPSGKRSSCNPRLQSCAFRVHVGTDMLAVPIMPQSPHARPSSALVMSADQLAIPRLSDVADSRWHHRTPSASLHITQRCDMVAHAFEDKARRAASTCHTHGACCAFPHIVCGKRT